MNAVVSDSDEGSVYSRHTARLELGPDRNNADTDQEVVSAFIKEVNALLAQGHTGAASELLEEYIVNHPEQPAVIRLLARTRLLQGRKSEAIQLLQEAAGITSRESRNAASFVTGGQRKPGSREETISGRDLDYLDEHACELEAHRERFDFDVERDEQEDKIRVDPADVATISSIPNSAVGAIVGDALRDKVAEEARTSPDADRDEHGKPRVPLELDAGTPHSENNLNGEISDNRPTGTNEIDTWQQADDLVPDEEDIWIHGEQEVLLYEESAPEVRVGRDQYSFPDMEEFDDLPDFDERPIREEFRRGAQHKESITRKQRAMQEAIKLGMRFGWGEEGIEYLADVFERHGWSRSKVVIERELEAGLLPDELRLAFAARDIWRGYPEFAVSTGNFPYFMPSWTLALKIVRSFRSYPDVDEIEMFLVDVFVEWSDTPALMTGFESEWDSRTETKSFHNYLLQRLEFPYGDFTASSCVRLGDGYDKEQDDYVGCAYLGFNNPTHQDLVEYGLIPDEWDIKNKYVPWPEGVK